jgi:hypothetical protein|tara:strand:+ start:1346 stop:1456 length:111 start_codon:yes stop_codon:yes gene_type:complete
MYTGATKEEGRGEHPLPPEMHSAGKECRKQAVKHAK